MIVMNKINEIMMPCSIEVDGTVRNVVNHVDNRHKIDVYMDGKWDNYHECEVINGTPKCKLEGKTDLDIMKEEYKKRVNKNEK
jgi:hypothetical protein